MTLSTTPTGWKLLCDAEECSSAWFLDQVSDPIRPSDDAGQACACPPFMLAYNPSDELLASCSLSMNCTPNIKPLQKRIKEANRVCRDCLSDLGDPEWVSSGAHANAGMHIYRRGLVAVHLRRAGLPE
jgi:hypothetical protein